MTKRHDSVLPGVLTTGAEGAMAIDQVDRTVVTQTPVRRTLA